MRLRNKMTGEIKDVDCITIFDRPEILGVSQSVAAYYTLAELNEEWEDAPAEPLIKDEKISKAVRAWAKYCGIRKVLYAERPNKTLCCFTDMGKDDFAIEFAGSISSLKDGEVYSIDELCGEGK